MKKLIPSVIAFATVMGASAQSYNMEILLKNGSTTTISTEEISEVRFVESAPVEAFNILTEEYIPDSALRDAIKAQVANGSDVLTNVEAAAYNGALELNSPEVFNFKGIEYLTSLQALYGDYTKAQSIDVSMLKDLQVLSLSRCEFLKTLELGNPKKLRALNIGSTQLKQFDLSILPDSMAFINVESLGYATLDFSRFADIEEINCAQNELTSLNVENLPKLNSLVCSTNQLTELNLSGCTNLFNFVATFNTGLVKVNLDGCNKLGKVYLMYTAVTEFDAQPVKSTLEELNLGYTKISEINTSGCTQLTYLAVNDTQLTQAPDLKGCVNLDELRVENTHIPSLDVSDCSVIHEMHCYSIPELKSVTMASDLPNLYNLNLFDVPALTYFEWGKTKILGYANVYMTGLSRIDISKMNPDVRYGMFSYNENMTEIKVWPEFDIENPPSNIEKDANTKFVYEFTE